MVRMQLGGLLLVGLLGLQSARIQAAVVTLNLSQPASSLELSGTVTVAGVVTDAPITGQGGGTVGLSTDYTGSIMVDVDDLFNPTSITIVGASLDASVSGTWQPAIDGAAALPAAPADYGITVAAIGGTGAARDVNFNVVAATTSVTGGNFSVTGQTFSYNSGVLDVFSVPLNDGNRGTFDQSGDNTSTNQGSYTVAGNIATLTIPVEVSVGFSVPGTPLVTGTNSFVGQFVATATVPEPSAFGLIGLTLGGLALRRSRRST